MNDRNRQILAMFTSGYSHQEIADHFGISPSLSSQVVRKGRDALMTAFRSRQTVDELERSFGMSIRVIADEVRNEANKKEDYHLSRGEFDAALEWQHVAESAMGVTPPPDRGERRKQAIAKTSHGRSPVPEDERPVRKKRAGTPTTYAYCVSCDDFQLGDEMFVVNMDPDGETFVCKTCMSKAVKWLIDRREDHDPED